MTPRRLSPRFHALQGVRLALDAGRRFLAGLVISGRPLLQPSGAARAVLTAVAYLVFRTIFALADPVPGVIEYNPALAVAAATALLWGTGPAWGAAAGEALSHLLLRHSSGTIFYHTAAVLLFGRTVSALAPRLTQARLLYLRAALAVTLASLVAALWSAGGVDLCGLYPFTYIYPLTLAQYLFFGLLFGIPLARWYQRRADRAQWVASFPLVETAASSSEPRLLIPAAITAAAGGAAVALFAESVIEGLPLFTPALLGTSGGFIAHLALRLGMILALVLSFTITRRRTPSPISSPAV